jgi:hypothetical protein
MTWETFYIGCTCHCGHPPCGFCTGMAAEEADAYAVGGRAALEPFIGRMCNEDYELVLVKAHEN